MTQSPALQSAHHPPQKSNRTCWDPACCLGALMADVLLNYLCVLAAVRLYCLSLLAAVLWYCLSLLAGVTLYCCLRQLLAAGWKWETPMLVCSTCKHMCTHRNSGKRMHPVSCLAARQEEWTAARAHSEQHLDACAAGVQVRQDNEAMCGLVSRRSTWEHTLTGKVSKPAGV